MNEKRFQAHDLICDQEGKLSEVIYVEGKNYLLRYMDNYPGIISRTCWSGKIEEIDKNYEYVGYYGYDD